MEKSAQQWKGGSRGLASFPSASLWGVILTVSPPASPSAAALWKEESATWTAATTVRSQKSLPYASHIFLPPSVLSVIFYFNCYKQLGKSGVKSRIEKTGLKSRIETNKVECLFCYSYISKGLNSNIYKDLGLSGLDSSWPNNSLLAAAKECTHFLEDPRNVKKKIYSMFLKKEFRTAQLTVSFLVLEPMFWFQDRTKSGNMPRQGKSSLGGGN